MAKAQITDPIERRQILCLGNGVFFLSSSMVQVKNGCISNMIVSFHLGFSFQLLSRLLGDSQFFEGSPSLSGGGAVFGLQKKSMDRWDLPPFFSKTS